MKRVWSMLLICGLGIGCDNSDSTLREKMIAEEESKTKSEKATQQLELEKNNKEEYERMQKAEEEAESWDDPNYEYFAYKLTARTEGEHDGEPEYYYTGIAVSQQDAELHDIKTTPITNPNDKSVKIWRTSFEYTPESHSIILVKYKKGNRDVIEDIKTVYIPTGEFLWSNERDSSN
ncbi:hypothetical protein [Fictibacillus nanhaiensis]|uniref:hypothetical protein n=1 Tax=Fictibacillus nanhaiensis TaxID=742169 RepID=UPI003C2C25DD